MLMRVLHQVNDCRFQPYGNHFRPAPRAIIFLAKAPPGESQATLLVYTTTSARRRSRNMLPCLRQIPISFRASVGKRESLVVAPLLLTPTCSRTFSVLNRPPPTYDGHVPLTRIEKAALAAGSALGAVMNPRRAGTLLQACLTYTL